MASDNRIPDHQPPPGELPLCQPVLLYAQATPLHEREWISENHPNAKRRRHGSDEGSTIQELMDHHNYVNPNEEGNSSAGVIFKRSRQGVSLLCLTQLIHRYLSAVLTPTVLLKKLCLWLKRGY